MTRVERALVRVVSDLAALEVRWAVVGGLAVSVWAEPRLTRDIDVAVAVGSDEEAETVVRELCARGWRVVELVEQEAVGRIATVRLTSLANELEGILLDLLFASSGIETEIAQAAAMIEIVPGVILPVATRSHLVAMKLLARDDRSRPQDADDLRELIRTASPEEIAEAHEALKTITSRGFHRSRELTALLDRELAHARRPTSPP